MLPDSIYLHKLYKLSEGNTNNLHPEIFFLDIEIPNGFIYGLLIWFLIGWIILFIIFIQSTNIERSQKIFKNG